ncbi:MAG TPA: hypothetical protein PKC21_00220 [Oligoflexia bacterium]|nr:hypothetical protein [Oligoflexia bacterium]HMR23751.1 hypothetical protein [Oligoflexia bacterium]
MSKTGYKLKLNQNIKDYLKADAAKEKKLALIDGSVPVPLNELCTILTYFLNDSDPEIANLAQEELKSIPVPVLEGVLLQDIHPKTLDFFSQYYHDQEQLIENILLNKHCPNSVFLKLASQAKNKTLSLIINNQQKHLDEPKIISELKRNPNVARHEIDKAVSFLRINGIFVDGESSELSEHEISAILNMEDNMSFYIPKELLEDSSQSNVKISDKDEDKNNNVFQLIQKMNIAQKIKLALKGNKEARSILIKDSNKIVSSAVVKSPKITENEVIAIASLKSVHDEVIRIVSTKPQWVKLYALKLALCNNPKTPFKTALNFLKSLNVNDLQKISKNKNVSPQVSKVAKQLFKARRS